MKVVRIRSNLRENKHTHVVAVGSRRRLIQTSHPQQPTTPTPMESTHNHDNKKMKMSTPIMKVLGICGSLRQSSTNMSALKYMASQAPNHGMEFDIADLSQIPFLNTDTEDDKPESVIKLLDQMTKADAFVFASPEYNYSIAPALKNALDWGSRLPKNFGFKGKAAAILSAGGGMKGSRAQYHLRQVAVFLDLFVLNKPEVMFNAFDGTFDKETKELTSQQAQDRIVEQLVALKELATKLKGPVSEGECVEKEG